MHGSAHNSVDKGKQIIITVYYKSLISDLLVIDK